MNTGIGNDIDPVRHMWNPCFWGEKKRPMEEQMLEVLEEIKRELNRQNHQLEKLQKHLESGVEQKRKTEENRLPYTPPPSDII